MHVVMYILRQYCPASSFGETKTSPSVHDWQLLVRTNNFFRISLQINVYIFQISVHDLQLFQLSPENCLQSGINAGISAWAINSSDAGDGIFRLWDQYHAPVPLTILRSNSKFDQNWERSSLIYAKPITTKFCTRHDSYTVMTCVKFRGDRLSVF